ncbi:hypothetical protein AAF712_008159 [Marasmius tenuissimus]|uniref:Uncharacterized protein n=1 Tax=Marasmius tenuissimus TaxID=585030 RepID=A0ABR2ZTB1_9AGAR
MNENLVLHQIEEDWDTYEGASVDDSLPVDSVASPEDIKETLDVALHSSEQELVRAFRSWRAVVDSESSSGSDDSDDLGEEDTEIPHLFAVLLKGIYLRVKDDDPPFYQKTTSQISHPLNVSSLQESDRSILAKLAPYAKAYGFDVHLGQSTYTEIGDLDTGDVKVNSENAKEYEYPGDLREAQFLDTCHEDICDEQIRIDYVCSLDGIPMDMAVRTVDPEYSSYDSDEDTRNIFLNGSYNDGDWECEMVPYSRTGGPFLVRSWTRKVLLISPRDSPHIKFSLRPDSQKCMADQLERSSSDSPTVKEKKFVDALFVWLKEGMSKFDPSLPFNPAKYSHVAQSLLDSAYRWMNAELLGRVIDACTQHTVAIIGADRVLAGYHAFGGEITMTTVVEASKTEPSVGLQIQLVEKLLAAGQDNHDSSFVSWCTERLESLFQIPSKIEASAVDFVIKNAELKPNPTEALQDMRVVSSRFGPVIHSDAEMWKVLFDKLRELGQSDLSPFDRVALQQLTFQCLQRIALELPPYTTTKFSSRMVIHIKHIVLFVELCLQYDATKTPAMFFCRMKDGVAEHDRKSRSGSLAHEFYAELVKEFDALIKAKAGSNEALRDVLKTFFDDAVEVMLPNFSVRSYDDCPDKLLPVEAACVYLDDPIKAFRLWLSPSEQTKNENTEIIALHAAKRLLKTIRKQNLLPRDAGDELFRLVVTYVENHIQKFDPSIQGTSQVRGSTATVSTNNHKFLSSAVEFFICAEQPQAEQVGRLLRIVLVLGVGAQHVKNVLMPFLNDIKLLLSRQEQKHLMTEPPYSEFTASVVEKWLMRVLGARPFSELALEDLKVGCDCALCTKHLVPVLNGGQRGQRKFRAQVVSGEKQHFEAILEGLERWGVTWRVIRVIGDSHKYQIERPGLDLLNEWRKRATEARELLKSLGTDGEQQKILGFRYQWAKDFVAGIHAQPPTSALSEPSPAHSHVAKRPLESPPDGNSKRLRLT